MEWASPVHTYVPGHDVPRPPHAKAVTAIYPWVHTLLNERLSLLQELPREDDDAGCSIPDLYRCTGDNVPPISALALQSGPRPKSARKRQRTPERSYTAK